MSNTNTKKLPYYVAERRGCYTGERRVWSRHRTWKAALREAAKCDRTVDVHPGGMEVAIPMQNHPDYGPGCFGRGLPRGDRAEWVKQHAGLR